MGNGIVSRAFRTLWASLLSLRQDNIQTTYTEALVLENGEKTTAATVTQQSPGLTLRSRTWQSGGGAQDLPFEARTYIQPVTGTSPQLVYAIDTVYGASAAQSLLRLWDLGRCAVGGTAVASNSFCVAMGHNATASGISSICIGGNGVGETSSATANGTLAIGSNVNATAIQAFAIGKNSTANGQAAYVFGIGNTGSGFASFTLGNNATANGANQTVIGIDNTILPTSASASYVATDPAWIIGNGTGTTQAARSYAAYITFDSRFRLGGRQTTSDATGSQSATGIMEFGFANNTTVAKVTSASHSASRTYTLDDMGANASFVMTSGNQMIGDTKTFSGELKIGGSEVLHYTDTSISISLGTTDRFANGDGTSGGFTINLPSTPIDGQIATVTKVDSSASPISVGRNGHNFVDSPADATLLKQGSSLTSIYIGSLSKWLKLYASDTSSYNIVYGGSSTIVAASLLIGSAGNRFEKGFVVGGTGISSTLSSGNIVVAQKDILGVAVLVPTVGGSTVTILDPGIVAASLAQVTVQVFGGGVGFLSAVCTIGSLVITSTSATDSSSVQYRISVP
jgi:hypothetical protein